MPSREQERMWRLAGRYSAIGIEIAVAITLPTLLGNWLDGKVGTRPLFLIIGIVIGVGAAVRTLQGVVRDVRKREDGGRRS